MVRKWGIIFTIEEKYISTYPAKSTRWSFENLTLSVAVFVYVKYIVKIQCDLDEYSFIGVSAIVLKYYLETYYTTAMKY